MNDKFTIIKGQTECDYESITRSERIITMCKIWQRQFDNVMKEASSLYGDKISDYSQESLMKIAFAGVKLVCTCLNARRERERRNIVNDITVDEALATYSYISSIFVIMGYINLRNFVITFPINKCFDGDKWEMKDYFFTMNELGKFDMDKPVGKEVILNLLWDYDNKEIRRVYVEFMNVSSKIRKSLTGSDMVDDFFENIGVGTITEYKKEGLIKDNKTGKIMKMRKISNLKVIK